jgi:hypothetical protein
MADRISTIACLLCIWAGRLLVYGSFWGPASARACFESGFFETQTLVVLLAAATFARRMRNLDPVYSAGLAAAVLGPIAFGLHFQLTLGRPPVVQTVELVAINWACASGIGVLLGRAVQHAARWRATKGVPSAVSEL